MEAAQPKDQQLDEEIFNELKLLQTRIKGWIPAKRLWRFLTKEERGQLGDDLESCYEKMNAVGMWLKLHPVSRPRAIVEVAREISVLDEAEYRRLAREIGEEAVEQRQIDVPPSESQVPTSVIELLVTPPALPRWCPETGELWFGDKLARKVRIMGNQSNIQLILEAFQAANWAKCIGNSLPGQDQQTLHEALRSLNYGISYMKFHAQKGGKEILWEVSEVPVTSQSSPLEMPL